MFYSCFMTYCPLFFSFQISFLDFGMSGKFILTPIFYFSPSVSNLPFYFIGLPICLPNFLIVWWIMLWSSIFPNNFSFILSLLLRFYSQLHVSLISRHVVSAAYMCRCVRLPNKAWIAYQKSHPRRKLTPVTLANINCQ